MSKNIEVIQVFPFFSGEYCPYWCKMTAWLCNFGTDQVSHWWLLAILFLHLHLHLGHGFGHSQGQLRLRLQLLLSTQEVHVLQRLRVILGGVPVWVGWTLLGLQGGSGGFFWGGRVNKRQVVARWNTIWGRKRERKENSKSERKE